MNVRLLSAVVCLFLAFSPALQSAEPDGKTVQIHPTYGVEYVPPEGWRKVNDHKFLRIATWQKRRTITEIAPAEITLEMYYPRPGATGEQKMEEMAAEFTRRFGGEATPLSAGVGGQRAVEILPTERSKRGPNPVKLTLVDRDNHVLAVTLFCSGSEASHIKAFDQLVGSTRWREPAAPVGHLELVPEDFPILGKQYVIRLPALAQQQPPPPQTNAYMLGIADYRARQLEYTLAPTSAPKTSDLTLDQYARQFGTMMRQKFGFQEDLKWSNIDLTLPARISNTVKAQKIGHARWCVLFSDSEVLVFTFIYSHADSNELPVYEALTRKILGTLRPAGTAAPPELRTWTSADGKFSTEGRLVAVKGESVQLKKANGTVIPVPLAKLSQADRDYVAAAGQPGDTKPPSLLNPKRYSNSKYGFSMQFPAGSEEVEQPANVKSIVTFRDSLRSVMMVMMVRISPAPANHDLDSFFPEVRQELSKQGREVETGELRANGRMWKWVDGVKEIESGSLRIRTYMTIIDKHAVAIIGTAMDNAFDKYKVPFDQAVATFRFD